MNSAFLMNVLLKGATGRREGQLKTAELEAIAAKDAYERNRQTQLDREEQRRYEIERRRIEQEQERQNRIDVTAEEERQRRNKIQDKMLADEDSAKYVSPAVLARLGLPTDQKMTHKDLEDYIAADATAKAKNPWWKSAVKSPQQSTQVPTGEPELTDVDPRNGTVSGGAGGSGSPSGTSAVPPPPQTTASTNPFRKILDNVDPSMLQDDSDFAAYANFMKLADAYDARQEKTKQQGELEPVYYTTTDDKGNVVPHMLADPQDPTKPLMLPHDQAKAIVAKLTPKELAQATYTGGPLTDKTEAETKHITQDTAFDAKRAQKLDLEIKWYAPLAQQKIESMENTDKYHALQIAHRAANRSGNTSSAIRSWAAQDMAAIEKTKIGLAAYAGNIITANFNADGKYIGKAGDEQHIRNMLTNLDNQYKQLGTQEQQLTSGTVAPQMGGTVLNIQAPGVVPPNYTNPPKQPATPAVNPAVQRQKEAVSWAQAGLRQRKSADAVAGWLLGAKGRTPYEVSQALMQAYGFSQKQADTYALVMQRILTTGIDKPSGQTDFQKALKFYKVKYVP